MSDDKPVWDSNSLSSARSSFNSLELMNEENSDVDMHQKTDNSLEDSEDVNRSSSYESIPDDEQEHETVAQDDRLSIPEASISDTSEPELKPSILFSGHQGLVCDWPASVIEAVFPRQTDDVTYIKPEVIVDSEVERRKEKRRLKASNGISLDDCFELFSRYDFLCCLYVL